MSASADVVVEAPVSEVVSGPPQTRGERIGDRAARGFAWNHLYKLVEYGLFNLYTILVVRHFGPELSAPYSVFNSVATTLAIISAFAVDGVLLRYTPRVFADHRDQNGEHAHPAHYLTELFAFRMFVTTVLAAVIFGICTGLPIVAPGSVSWIGSFQTLWPFLVLFLFGQAATAFSTFTLMGLLQVKSVFISSLIVRSVLLGAGVLLVVNSSITLHSAVGLLAGSSLLNGLLLLLFLRRELHAIGIGNKKASSAPLRRLARQYAEWIKKPSRVFLFLSTPIMLYGITTWGSDILSTVLGRQPDILMLRAIYGETSKEIGLYHAASLIVLMTEYVFLFGLGGTLVSVFSSVAKEDEDAGEYHYPRLARARKEVAAFQIVATMPLFAFMLLFAKSVVNTIYGAAFSEASTLVLCGVFFLAVNVGVFAGGMQITSLVAIGKQKFVFKNRLVWGLFNLGLNYLLILKFGAIGALIGTQACNAGACAVEGYLAKKLIGNAIAVPVLLKVLAIAALNGGIAYAITTQLLSLPSLLQCIAGGVLTMGLSMLGYYLLKVPEVFKILDRLRKLTGIRPRSI